MVQKYAFSLRTLCDRRAGTLVAHAQRSPFGALGSLVHLLEHLSPELGLGFGGGWTSQSLFSEDLSAQWKR